MKFPGFHGIQKDQQQSSQKPTALPYTEPISLTFHKLFLENQLSYIPPIHEL